LTQRPYRIPDVCLFPLLEPGEQIFTQRPHICIESRISGLLDPPSRRARAIVREGHFEALDGILRTSDGRVILKVPDLFQPLGALSTGLRHIR
jgi:hypothetical protein